MLKFGVVSDKTPDRLISYIFICSDSILSIHSPFLQPLPAVQHAMTRDGLDPSVMEGDHDRPVPEPQPMGGTPLKLDPAYAKYFKMLKLVSEQ